MKTIYQRKLHSAYEFPKKTVVALGSFDGFHIAHQLLVSEAVRYSEQHNLISLIYTYENHPGTVLNKEKDVQLLTSNQVRTGLFSDIKVECVYFEEFTDEYAELSPNEFVNYILKGKLNAEAVVVGFDYRFGKGGTGDVDCLKEICAKNGINVICIDPIYYDGEIISSTIIRNNLKQGLLDRVEAMLGRKFYIMGTVEHGKCLGGKMGFPTANIYPFETQALPSNGVYISNVFFDGEEYVGVTNVGINPTVEYEKNIKVETYILDYDGYLYGQDITVEFVKKVRDERVFADADELFARISKDAEIAREYCNDRNKC